MSMEDNIINWLASEGLFKSRLDDESANFHFIVDYPKDHVIDVIQPIGKNDMIIIGCATQIAEEQIKLIQKADPKTKENFIWDMKFGLNQFAVDFEIEHPNNELHGFVITDEIFSDGLTKNNLIYTIKKIYKSKIQSLWLLEKTFSELRSKNNDNIMFS